jgi:hypothetical protein
VEDVETKLIIDVVVLPTVNVIPATVVSATLLAPAVDEPTDIVVLAGSESVPVKPVQLIDWATELALSVTVLTPELASRKTSSFVVGTLTPLAPPVLAAQFAVVVPSQVAVPPTQ